MIDIKHYRIAIVLIAILSFLFSLPLGAQSREGARKQMNQGNYSTAITMLTALDELYPGQFSNDLRIARKCLNLQRSAKAKFKAQHFTEAESLYNQILELNPNDRGARQAISQCQVERNKYWTAEFAKCKTISDYRAFVQQYPNAPQAQTAREKVEEYDLTQEDSSAWATANRTGTVSSYSTYISKANSKAAHLGEAYRNRARLHFNNAINATTDNYRTLSYSSAKSDYENAKKKGAYLLAEDNNKYNACLAEDKFHNLGTYSSSYSITSYISWADLYVSNSFVSPHLHLETAYAMLVDAYCRGGRFDDARNVVEQHFGQMSSSYFTMNSTKEWSKTDWKKSIKERERQFKKDHRNNTATHYKKQNKQATKRTGSPSMSRSLNTEIPIRLPITLGVMGISNRYAQLGVGLTFGDYDNKFNLDLMVTSLSDGGYDEHVFFSIAPTYNIITCSEGDYHLNVQPVIGYNSKYSLMGGVRSGIGWDYFDFSIGASYAKDFGFMTDFKLRVNINLVGRKY